MHWLSYAAKRAFVIRLILLAKVPDRLSASKRLFSKFINLPVSSAYIRRKAFFVSLEQIVKVPFICNSHQLFIFADKTCKVFHIFKRCGRPVGLYEICCLPLPDTFPFVRVYLKCCRNFFLYRQTYGLK